MNLYVLWINKTPHILKFNRLNQPNFLANLLTLNQTVTIKVLLRYQIAKRNNRTTQQLVYPIRNILFEWSLRRDAPRDNPPVIFVYEKSLLSYIDLLTCHKIKDSLNNAVDDIIERYHEREEPFQLYEFYSSEELPSDRLPVQGIEFIEKRYHSIPSASLQTDASPAPLISESSFIETPDVRSNILFSEEIDLSGDLPVPEIAKIITDWFPNYVQYLHLLCRPPSYGPQAFHDFNRATDDPPPPSPERHELIMSILRQKLGITPYRPLHYADALAGTQPLNTSASYFSKFNPRTRVFAKYSTPSLYRDRPTSKGFNYNVLLNEYRRELHNVKYDGFPFPADLVDPDEHATTLQHWFDKHPAQLFIRTQISKRDPNEPKKIRPVYSVDDRFLHLEKMLLLPALMQLRNPQSCVAHGIETFRGGMNLLNQVLSAFESFISIDWSQFDQRLPRFIITAFFLDYLPSILIVSHGYMPTRQYPDSTQDTLAFARKIFNLVKFLYVFYLRMIFLTFDGFAYLRLHGGVPSGMLNTQHLDSFGNMYVIVDCLLEFGFTHDECLQMLFCVMGDDNLIFMKHNFNRIIEFMSFLETYSRTRHGMILSILKSAYSNLASKLTFLSFDNDNGYPTRPVSKLVAQLAFPERPVPPERNWIHAARALGLAYANCGQSWEFHLLCKMVYDKFKTDEPVPTHHLDKIFKKWKYQLPLFDITCPEYTFPEFPTYQEIRSSVSSYLGSLHESDHWNFDVFSVPPSDNLTNYTTLKDIILQNEEMLLDVNKFWHGIRSL
jgi:hypothetical protein